MLEFVFEYDIVCIKLAKLGIEMKNNDDTACHLKVYE